MHCELRVPEQPWSVELTREDAERFWTLMHVANTWETSNEVVWLTIIDRARYWFTSEPNVVMWGRVDSSEAVDSLMIPFSTTALNSLFNFLMTHETCDITVEVDEIPKKHVTVCRSRSGDYLYANVPAVASSVPDLSTDGDVSCEITGPQTHLLGDFMRTWPSGVTPEGHPTPFLPAFAHLVVDGEGVRCSMDWTRYGGSLNTVGLAAPSNGSGSIQFEPSVVSRALGRFRDEQPMTITFDSAEQTAVCFHNDAWGFRVMACREPVARWGFLVSSLLEENDDIEVGEWETDEIIPSLSFSYHDSPMSVSIVSDTTGSDDYLRVALNVASNVVFNLDLMQELNTYNNMSVGVSAVFNDDDVFLVADVPCVAYRGGLQRAIRRLHERQHDLVAIVAMFGDGPTLFDEQGNPTA